MKQVRESAALKSIRIYGIFKDGERVAEVQVHYSNSGTVRVDIWQYDGSGLVYQGKAGGYGYDKFTAAIAGAEICGVKIYDHSVGVSDWGHSEPDKTKHPELWPILESQDKEAAKKIGASFANWKDGRYESLYYVSGLDRLQNFGYKIYQFG